MEVDSVSSLGFLVQLSFDFGEFFEEGGKGFVTLSIIELCENKQRVRVL